MPVFLAARKRFFYINRLDGSGSRCVHRDCPLLAYSTEAQSLAACHAYADAASSMRGSSTNAISVYLQLTLVCSAAVWILIIWSGHLNMGYGLVIRGSCGVRHSRAAHFSSSRQELSSLGWRWPQLKYLAVAYFVPLAYASVAYGAVWHCNLGVEFRIC